ncbi:MAG: hypothetical protein ACXV7D_10335, partial [Thermoanaerobaculia bacterium]
MKRSLMFLCVLILASVARAEDVIRPVAVIGDLNLLTQAQRDWLSAFQSGAVLNTADGADVTAAASWLDAAAAGAREASLDRTADYLAVASRVLRGEAPIEEAEKALRRTLDESLLVIVQLDGPKIATVTVCTCDPARTRAIEKSIDRFERSLPGFRSSWIDNSPTRAITRIANFHFRAGRNANVAPTGTYLPFDRGSAPKIGRTWIVYDNMIRATWWGEGVRPVALRVMPSAAPKATAEAMIEWYGHRAPLYDAGPTFTAAERDRLGASKDPLSIVKGDLMPVLLAGASDESVAILTAVSFDTLRDVMRGNAPPPHKPATTAEINWLVEHGGLRYDSESVTWQVDFDRCRAAVRSLAAELMAIEAAGDAKRAEALFARYGETTPAIEK